MDLVVEWLRRQEQLEVISDGSSVQLHHALPVHQSLEARTDDHVTCYHHNHHHLQLGFQSGLQRRPIIPNISLIISSNNAVFGIKTSTYVHYIFTTDAQLHSIEGDIGGGAGKWLLPFRTPRTFSDYPKASAPV